MAGRLVRTPTGVDLVLVREFPDAVADVWASVVESERTAQWFGPWEADPEGEGQGVKVRMVFEDGEPWIPMRVVACEAPTRLALFSSDENGEWHVEVLLAERAGRS